MTHNIAELKESERERIQAWLNECGERQRMAFSIYKSCGGNVRMIGARLESMGEPKDSRLRAVLREIVRNERAKRV